MEKNPNSPYKFRYVPRAKTEEEKIRAIEKQLGGKLTANSLSEEQHEAFEAVCEWKDNTLSLLKTLGGYAGTGKSTLVATLANEYEDDSIAFTAFTGKAASVLRRKLDEVGAASGRHDTKTLHSLMYYPIGDEDSGTISGWRRRPTLEYDLLVVDEASMLDQKLYADLASYEIPILAVGDHGQLPPIFGSFNLMEHPDIRLETIHRQASDSPILALSSLVRRIGQVPNVNTPDNEVQVLELRQLDNVINGLFSLPELKLGDTGILTFTNQSRVMLNNKARDVLWQKDKGTAVPRVGDQVICLRNVEGTIFNGMRGTIKSLDPSYETVHHLYGRVLFEEDEISVEGPICKYQFGRETTIRDFDEYEEISEHRVKGWDAVGLLFDYGYALTIHKAQGSQFEHVVVVNSPPARMDFDTKKRALYTAVTRCSKYLVVLQ